MSCAFAVWHSGITIGETVADDKKPAASARLISRAEIKKCGESA